MSLATQHWDRYQIVIAQKRHQGDSVWRFLFIKEMTYLSLDDNDVVIGEMRTRNPPRNESEWTVEIQSYDDDKFVCGDSLSKPTTLY
jgi:hypothetical protein